METLSFTLGVLAVIDLLIVAGTFLVLKTMNTIRKQAEQTQRELDANVRELHYEVERYRNDLYERISNVEKQVIQHTDSRVDKLETKVYKDFDLFRTQGRNY
jgi:C4-dicarboxylate-specific signal transduction histidine kinase